jgi:serpin B
MKNGLVALFLIFAATLVACDYVNQPATTPETTHPTLPSTTPEAMPPTLPSTTPETTPPTLPSTAPETTHPTLPSTTPADVPELVDGISSFTFDLYHELSGGDNNILYSPYSLTSVLAMTYAGARGDTAQQMADALGYTLLQDSLHPSFYQLNRELMQLRNEEVEGFRLDIVNALWGQEGYQFLPDYTALVAEYYGGDLYTLDFFNEPEASRIEINDWASEQTEGRINDLLPPGIITKLTRLVLSNAIYFNARWQTEFLNELTYDDMFYLLDGTTVMVPMMHQECYFDYSEAGDYQAISLPYLGNELAMIILLPNEGSFTAFEDSLDEEVLQRILDNMEHRQVELALPKFSFEGSYSLNQPLIELGVTDAFSPDLADFSGMTGTKELSIGMVMHKTWIAVDETGTEAAAISAVLMFGAPPPSAPVSFNANRPFIFFIRDIESGAILFMGRVMNPVN